MKNITLRFPFILTVLLLGALPVTAGQGKPPATAEDRRIEQAIDSLLSRMTLEEEVGQLQQYTGSWSDSLANAWVTPRQRELVRQGRVGSLLNVFGSAITRDLQRIAVEESRLHIPLLFGFDVIHGFRTTFPIPLAAASSWDTGAVKHSARIAAAEAAAAGIHWTFAPMVDIARDPRWGRIAEGAGEDPYLGSLMAEAQVKGFQGDDLRKNNTIMACVKHFAAYGAAEGGRDYNSVDISERALRDVYLPPFEAAIRAGAGSIMTSFNEIAGIPSTANRHLVTEILRQEWEFDGLVVSDWNSVGELYTHRIASSPKEAGALAITAGTDMDMEGGIYRDHLVQLVNEGTVPAAAVHEAVRHVLRAKFRLGLFDDPYRYCSAERERAVMLHPTHIQAAREAARKSIVLLKNEGSVLPLSKNIATLAVIGPLADDHRDPLGSWAGPGRMQDVVTVLDGITKAVSPRTRVLYARGCEIEGDSAVAIDAAVAIARRADAVILVVGESAAMSGESACRASLGLPGRQEELVRAITAAGKPVVAVLMNGRPLAIPWMAANVPAILEAWFLGLQTGPAVADVVFGDWNPSGKLPVSFPREVGQIPVYYNHKNTGRPPVEQTVNYTSRYLDLPFTPLFPFGHGLSYTTFSYSDLRLSAPTLAQEDQLVVTVKVRNTGQREGDETAQLYICDEYGSVTRPVMELKGFQKLHLTPGEERTVEFSLSPGQLAFHGKDMRRGTEPGTFKVYVGTSSASVLTGSFTYLGPRERTERRP